MVEAWRRFIPSYLQAGLPLLAWTTPSGSRTLKSVWPGLIAQAQVIELPTITEASLLQVVQERMGVIGKDRRIEFEEGFAEEILARRGEWPVESLADPGRTLALLEQIIDLPDGTKCETLACANDSRLLRLKKSLRRLIANDKLSAAKELIHKIEKLKLKLVATAPPPMTRTVSRIRIDSFLEVSAMPLTLEQTDLFSGHSGRSVSWDRPGPSTVLC